MKAASGLPQADRAHRIQEILLQTAGFRKEGKSAGSMSWTAGNGVSSESAPPTTPAAA